MNRTHAVIGGSFRVGIVIEYGVPVYHFETPRPFISPLTLYGHASCKILYISGILLNSFGLLPLVNITSMHKKVISTNCHLSLF